MRSGFINFLFVASLLTLVDKIQWRVCNISRPNILAQQLNDGFNNQLERFSFQRSNFGYDQTAVRRKQLARSRIARAA
ncbi:MAG TPA: hypothetical protein VGX24_03795 [Pyrinomonadaceae bacterium]|nr:hypothetical protein [Pyrinomonadaceae bacterium]